VRIVGDGLFAECADVANQLAHHVHLIRGQEFATPRPSAHAAVLVFDQDAATVVWILDGVVVKA
jgi:hypothetical protein